MSFIKPAINFSISRGGFANLKIYFQQHKVLKTIQPSKLTSKILLCPHNSSFINPNFGSCLIPKYFSSLSASRAPNKDDKGTLVDGKSLMTFTDNTKEDYVSMNWDQYFEHKKMRRLRDKLLSFPAAIISSVFTASYLMTNVVLDASDNGLIFGLDPFIVFAAASAGSGLVAFLVTPLLGSLIYRLLKPKVYREMMLKDADFYQRIVKYRVNMSVQPRSVSAPPDFYGEKVLSRKDYRHWLRRQFDYKRQMAY